MNEGSGTQVPEIPEGPKTLLSLKVQEGNPISVCNFEISQYVDYH